MKTRDRSMDEACHVTYRDRGYAKGGVIRFKFEWLIPNPRYGQVNPQTGKKYKTGKWRKRGLTLCFVSATAAEEYARLQERHLLSKLNSQVEHEQSDKR